MKFVGVGLFIISVLSIFVFLGNTPPPGPGRIRGEVTIGPLCPVEPCPNPPPEIYSSRQLVLQNDSETPRFIPLNPDGTFQAMIPAGTYTVGMTDCIFLGCTDNLPKTIVVHPNETTFVTIIIDTGIQASVDAGAGAIAGKVTIGPLCPVEPCTNPPPEIYSSRQLVLQPDSGNSRFVPLNPDGTFQATMPAGTYTVNMTDCSFLGCTYSMPITITIRPNETTFVIITIDTGIRAPPR